MEEQSSSFDHDYLGSGDDTRLNKKSRLIVASCSILGVLVVICSVIILMVSNNRGNDASETELDEYSEVNNDELNRLIQDVRAMDLECSYSCNVEILKDVDEIIKMENTYESAITVCHYGVKYSLDEKYAKYCDISDGLKGADNETSLYERIEWGSDEDE